MKSSSIESHAPRTGLVPVSRQILVLLGWLAVTFAAAAMGGIASGRAGEFYQALSLPEWAPPAQLFGPVWGTLYLLMGVAAWLVWRRGGFDRSGGALPVFVVQLGMNALWPWLFFFWRLGGWAFTEIMLLWALVATTLMLFWRVRPIAGLLLVPYLAWITFAAALCRTVWRMNPDLLG
jgi:tryptophan-rich sensory protein